MIFLAVVVFAARLAIPALGAEAPKPGATQQKQLQPPVSAKVQSILQRLLRGDSAAELRKAVNEIKLTEAEKQQLRTAISKPEYQTKIEALKRSVAASRKTLPQPPLPGKSLDQLRSAIETEQRQRVQTLNQQAAVGLQKAKSQARLSLSRPPAQPTIPVPTPQGKIAASGVPAGAVATSAVIRVVWPAQPVVGQTLEIRSCLLLDCLNIGTGFGDEVGAVKLLFRRGPSGHSVYPCVVNEWSKAVITVTVPNAIEDLYHYYDGFAGGVEPATLLVVPAGADLGAGKDLTVALDPERANPEVLTFTPSQITPGSRVTLEGRNLSIVGTPRVRFQNEYGEGRSLTVRSHHRHSIEAEMPADVSGIRQSVEATLTVDNGLSSGSSAAAIRFIPAEEIREVVTPVGCDSDELLNFFDLFTICRNDENSREITLDVGNGWRLESFSGYRRDDNVGCYWSRTPVQAPSGHISGVGVAWAERCESISCRFTLVLRGPRGVPFR
jgi:hypothetical protein